MSDLCTCEELADRGRRRFGSHCSLHVDCDMICKALREPVTTEEVAVALEHWESHSYLAGCSHGC